MIGQGSEMRSTLMPTKWLHVLTDADELIVKIFDRVEEQRS